MICFNKLKRAIGCKYVKHGNLMQTMQTLDIEHVGIHYVQQPCSIRPYTHSCSMMAFPRPYVSLRRSLCRLAQTQRNTHVPRCAFRQFRRYSSGQKQQEPLPVWRPYLRLAIGIPFIGALVYSMVRAECNVYRMGVCDGNWDCDSS